MPMPTHACIDPNDQYAQEEVLVEFEIIADGIVLISARDPSDDDILADLEDVQLEALKREILADYPRPRRSRDRPRHRESIVGEQQFGWARDA